MKSFFVTNDNGVIVKKGVCQASVLDEHSIHGKVHEGVPEDHATHFIDGKFSHQEAPLTYSRLRSSEYPNIFEQLDAIWKGGLEMEQMRQRIRDVKEKHPKKS